jgi:hypothetical protein
MTEYCICGHSKKDHFKGSVFNKKGYREPGELCSHIYNGDCGCDVGFKLDNLKLIEELAKEKGLV